MSDSQMERILDAEGKQWGADMRKARQEFDDEMAGLRERDRMMIGNMTSASAVPPPGPAHTAMVDSQPEATCSVCGKCWAGESFPLEGRCDYCWMDPSDHHGRCCYAKGCSKHATRKAYC